MRTGDTTVSRGVHKTKGGVEIIYTKDFCTKRSTTRSILTGLLEDLISLKHIRLVVWPYNLDASKKVSSSGSADIPGLMILLRASIRINRFIWKGHGQEDH